MDKKYEFTGETKDWYGHTLRRIRAVVTFAYAKAGELGGWIEKEENLSQGGNAWVSGDAAVFGYAKVSGNAAVSGYATVYGNAKVSGNAAVSGYATVYGNATVFGNAKVSGNATVCGNATVYGNAEVSGYATVSGNARVYGDAEVSGYATVLGYATVCDSAAVFGNAWVSGNAEVYGAATVGDSADYVVFKNCWSSHRWFTYTHSNKMWKVGCFYGTGDELIRKAYSDSEISGRCYEAVVKAVETIEKAKGENK